MIVLSGLVPDRDIPITFTGLRPGEKLFEELFEESEQVEATAHDKIRRVVKTSRVDTERLERFVKELEEILLHGDDEEVSRRLGEMVPTYTPVSPPTKSLTRQPA
jgi:FlaA1/EpsC-like NDP-sugar epimerase